MPFLRSLWNKFLEFDRGLHARLSARYPKAIPTIDHWITAIVDGFLSNPVLAVVLAFVALILGVAGLRPLVLVSASIGWAVCFLWAARSKRLQRLTVVARLLASMLTGTVLALGFWGFGNWALVQHGNQEESSIPQKVPQASLPLSEQTGSTGGGGMVTLTHDQFEKLMNQLQQSPQPRPSRPPTSPDNAFNADLTFLFYGRDKLFYAYHNPSSYSASKPSIWFGLMDLTSGLSE